MSGEKFEDFEDFLRRAANELPPPTSKFTPCWFYNEPGDMIEIYLSNEARIAEWVNKDITVLYSIGLPKKVVGVQISGVKKHINGV